MAHGMDLMNIGLASASTVRKFSSNAVAATAVAAGGTGVVNSLISNNVTSIGTIGQSSRKKLYERMLMIRKVKSYLSELPFIESESELDRRSMECEPPAPGTNTLGSGFTTNININQNASNNFDKTTFLRPVRRRMASPSSSSLSSHSTLSTSTSEIQKRTHMPKFGNFLFLNNIYLFFRRRINASC